MTDRGASVLPSIAARLDHPDRNAIGVLRLVLAGLVIVSHACGLGGFGADALWSFSRQTRDFGDVGVDGFFVLSGFLITQSFRRSPNLVSFLWARCLRIFPGFWLCLAITSLGIGFLAQHHQHDMGVEYFLTRTNGPYSYIAHNALFLSPRNAVLDSFSGNPVAWSFNNSLWTLPREFGCYLLAALLGLAGAFAGKHRLLVAAFVISWLLMLITLCAPDLLEGAPAWRNVRLPVYFLAGCLARVWIKPVWFNPWIVVMAGAALVIATRLGAYDWIAPVAFTLLLLNLAAWLPGRGLERRIGDYSYGLYLYGFPIQQLLVLWGIHTHGYALYLIATIIPTGVLACFSWHLVELPALSLKRRLTRARQTTVAATTSLPT